MKIKLRNLEKLYKHATADEIDFLLYTAQFQDEFGRVSGISYKDICIVLDISKSNFYKVFYSLEKKGIISINYRCNDKNGLWEFVINDNIFISRLDEKEGYLNINNTFLHTNFFYQLTKSEKVIILHILTLYRPNRNNIRITVEKLMEWTKSGKISVLKYIKKLSFLKNFFKISKLDNVIQINTRTEGFSRRDESEKDILHRHEINFILRQKRMKADTKAINDTLILFKQYRKLGFYKIRALLDYCLREKAELLPRYINKIAQLAMYGNFIWC